MKNTKEQNNLAELHPEISPHSEPSAYISNDEISLIDLTLVLLSRKALIGTVLALSLIAGYSATLFSTINTQYSTTIKIGTQIVDNELEPLETPETLLAKINHSFIPQTLGEYPGPYSINASIPKKSEIILLKASVQGAQDTTPIKLLKSLSQKIILDHHIIYTTIKRNLETSLKPVSIEAFAAQTASLQKTYMVSEPIKSSSGTNSKIILVVSLFAGLFLGIFAAFFAEFWSKVKEKQQKVES